jgi:hypothetical protein
MALRDWLSGAATVATPATVNTDPGRSVASVANVATSGQAAELRELVGIVAANWPDDERAEAMATALVDPDAALVCFRALVAERGGAPADNKRDQAPAEMRPCTDCLVLSPGGRCLAAWRGDLPGFVRSYAPAMTDRPQRCLGYAPGPNDPDKRTGRERWPWL